MIRVAIVGATGYTAAESLNILLHHPQARITYLTALPEECGPIEEVFPQLRGRIDLPVEPLDLDKARELADVVFCCLPHTVSMDYVPQLLDAGLRVIDFSADYRLASPTDYQQWYNHEHRDPGNLSRAVYGLCELFTAKIPGTDLLANPGCYPTGAVLGIAPLLSAGLADPDDVIVNAATGISGAGRKASLLHHFPERNETFEAYAVGTHRHQIEIQRVLEQLAGRSVNVLFVPHLVPMERGILSTIYLRPAADVTEPRALDALVSIYETAPFVRVGNALPSTRYVARTNLCDITVRLVGGRLIVITAIDNLIKGASGQAVQNMNLMFGLKQTMGLL